MTKRKRKPTELDKDEIAVAAWDLWRDFCLKKKLTKNDALNHIMTLAGGTFLECNIPTATLKYEFDKFLEYYEGQRKENG